MPILHSLDSCWKFVKRFRASSKELGRRPDVCSVHDDLEEVFHLIDFVLEAIDTAGKTMQEKGASIKPAPTATHRRDAASNWPCRARNPITVSFHRRHKMYNRVKRHTVVGDWFSCQRRRFEHRATNDCSQRFPS
mmetsp:Transcript_23592/g.34911  ORF Transcript_23592/g.34911 Transcript_23592/m.34911 type:complete len:135 (+) Transcript_23592:502-906(+)